MERSGTRTGYSRISHRVLQMPQTLASHQVRKFGHLPLCLRGTTCNAWIAATKQYVLLLMNCDFDVCPKITDCSSSLQSSLKPYWNRHHPFKGLDRLVHVQGEGNSHGEPRKSAGCHEICNST